jgi:hypothetical protein
MPNNPDRQTAYNTFLDTITGRCKECAYYGFGCFGLTNRDVDGNGRMLDCFEMEKEE